MFSGSLTHLLSSPVHSAGKHIPIECVTSRAACESGGMHADSTLRLDGEESCRYEDIAGAIKEIRGVVAHGLVLKDNVTAVVNTPEGDIQILRKVTTWHHRPLAFLGLHQCMHAACDCGWQQQEFAALRQILAPRRVCQQMCWRTHEHRQMAFLAS